MNFPNKLFTVKNIEICKMFIYIYTQTYIYSYLSQLIEMYIAKGSLLFFFFYILDNAK